MQSISKIFNASWLENITQKSGNSSLITISLRVIVKVESQVQLARNGKKRRGEIEIEIQRAVDEGKGLTTTNITLRC